MFVYEYSSYVRSVGWEVDVIVGASLLQVTDGKVGWLVHVNPQTIERNELVKVYTFSYYSISSSNLSFVGLLININWCELQGPGFSSPRLKDQRFVLSY